MAFLRELVVLLFLVTFCLADDPSAHYCNPKTTLSSSVSANIDHLLADLVLNFEHEAHFVTASYGSYQNQVYGLAQCWSNMGPSDCMGCIKEAAQQVRKLCPKEAEVRIWYDNCFLRYSQEKSFGKEDTSNGVFIASAENVTDPDSFNSRLGNLFDKIISAAVKPLNEGLGKGLTKLSDSDTLYGLAQCTRDLSPLSCAQCLATATQNFNGFCRDKKGCRVYYSSCSIRYELYPFFSQY